MAIRLSERRSALSASRENRTSKVLLVRFLAIAWTGLAWMTITAEAQLSASQITYSATIRSFMAISCRLSAGDSLFADNYCPNDNATQNRIRSGLIGGHPDFERNNPSGASVYPNRKGAVYYYNGTYARFGRGFPVTSRFDINPANPARPYVLSDLKVDTAGIAKMQYCRGEEGYLCDYNQTIREVKSAESFATWYSDSAFYNRRMGYKQPLYRVANTAYRYEFDAANPAHNKLGNKLFDPISLFNLSSRAWPMSKFEGDGGICPSKGCPAGKFWFTTEIHTYFQYRGGEEFLFSGDDDVHIFINGKLAINLGGEHSALPISIELDTYAQELDIRPGGIYAFDLFHVERQTSGSNFKITTTLAEACNVVALDLRSNGTDVTLGINWRSQPGAAQATQDSQWYLLGGEGFAVFSPPAAGVYATLMRPGVADVAAYMFHKNSQNVGSGFSLSFSFKVSGTGHGFTVIFHDRTLGLTSFNGGSGPNLGLRNLDKSFAVVFDFCPLFPDCSSPSQQLRLHYPSSMNQFNANTATTRRAFDGNVLQDWRDGLVHTVQIKYYATPDWLEVYVDDSLRLVERGFDIDNVIGGRNAYVGFTSSSSSFGKDMTVEVGEVALTTVKVNSRLSTVVNTTFPVPLIADGRASAGLQIQSRDGCGNEVRFGGLGSLAKGRAIMRVMRNSSAPAAFRRLEMIKTTVEQPARVVDNGDGTYSLLFSSSDVGSASLYVAFGASCTWNGTQFVGSDSDCFHTAFPDAMALLAPHTPSPTSPRGDPDEVPFPWIIVYGVSIGLGSVFCCCCFLALCLLRYRRKWRSEKKFVPTGQQAVLDRDLEIRADPRGAKFNELTRKVQQTSLEINKLRAVSEFNAEKDIEVVKDQNEKIKDAMKGMKRRQQEKDLIQQTSSKRTLARDELGPASRRSFAPQPVNGGVLASPAEVLYGDDSSSMTNSAIPAVFVARKNPKAAFLVSVSERDVEHMIQLANMYAEVLVGGELYGQMYENGDMIVMHSTGPGYGASMDQDNFVQSPSFVVEATDLMGTNSAFRVGSWISTSTRGKAVSEILRQSLVAARSSMPHAPRLIIMLVQLCGIKNGAMVVTITPYRYDLTGSTAGEVGDLYVFKDDADALAKRRHEALEVLRSRPPPVPVPATASSSRPAPPQGPPPKRRFDDVSGPPVPPSRPLSQNLSSGAGAPPAPPPSRAPVPGGAYMPEQQVPTPRRFSITEEDENPLVPVIMDGSAEDNRPGGGAATSRTSSIRGFFKGQ